MVKVGYPNLFVEAKMRLSGRLKCVLIGIGGVILGLVSNMMITKEPGQQDVNTLTFVGFMTGWMTAFMGPIFALLLFPSERKKRTHEQTFKMVNSLSANVIDVATAANPNAIGQLQIIDDYTREYCCGWNLRSQQIVEVVEVDGKAVRNKLGTGCFICGTFVENPDAMFAGRLAPFLLGKQNVIKAFETMHAMQIANGVTKPDSATDQLLAKRETELRQELGRITDARQRIAFAQGKPLDPPHPHRG